jgi:hypothetical protein
VRASRPAVFTSHKVAGRHGVADPFARRTYASSAPLELYPSQWVEHFVKIKNGDTGFVDPMDFKERRYLKRVYDTPSRRRLLFTSRQTEKSTTLGNLILSLMGLRAMYTPLFVSPSAMQTKVFSTTRIDDIIEVSPLIRAMTHQSLRMNILEKEFINHSKLYLRYAFLSADRIRGLSVNAIFLDEIQDIMQDLLPVIEETASHHKDSLFCYSGTPKTFDNTIEVYWSKHSTQNEWAIPCERHGTPKDKASWHWNILGEKNIGKNGPICEACGGPITAEHPEAAWVEMNPGAEIEGFRICRLMVPWFAKNPDKWKEILYAMERYPRAQWMNEVMALSYDSGSKPLTRAELIRACDDRFPIADEEFTANLGKRFPLYAGIDWSGGGNTENSAYTIMTIGGYVRGDPRFQIVFMKRFEGPLAEPDAQIKEIMRLLKKFNIRLTGVDFGGGFFPNKDLTNVFGPSRIHAFQYVGRAPGKLMYKPQLHRYLVFRSLVMADIFQAIKKMKIAFPKWDGFREPFASDMLNIRSEYNEALKLIQFVKVRSVTDDSFHSVLYCLLVSMLEQRRPDIMAPIMDGNDPESLANQSEERAIVELEPFAPSADDLEYGGGRNY